MPKGFIGSDKGEEIVEERISQKAVSKLVLDKLYDKFIRFEVNGCNNGDCRLSVWFKSKLFDFSISSKSEDCFIIRFENTNGGCRLVSHSNLPEGLTGKEVARYFLEEIAR